MNEREVKKSVNEMLDALDPIFHGVWAIMRDGEIESEIMQIVKRSERNLMKVRDNFQQIADELYELGDESLPDTSGGGIPAESTVGSTFVGCLVIIVLVVLGLIYWAS